MKETRIKDLLKFASEHPVRPNWPAIVIRRFLAQLISTEDLVLEVFTESDRIGAAVLIDKIQNPGNHACLEWIGIKTSMVSCSDVIEKLITMAADRLPLDRGGFQVTLHESFQLHDNWIGHNRLEPYYDTYEMGHERPAEVAMVASHGIELVQEADLSELYAVLCESFKDNPDTSIPTFHEWKESRNLNSSSFTWVHKDAGRIAGFVHLVLESEVAEIRTLGVLPTARRCGLGRRLLNYTLNNLAKRGQRKCRLTVATQNAKALELYRSLGFHIVDRYQVFLFNPNGCHNKLRVTTSL